MIKGDSNELGNAICEQLWVRKRKVDFTMAEKEPNVHGCMCSYKYHENYEIPLARTLDRQPYIGLKVIFLTDTMLSGPIIPLPKKLSMGSSPDFQDFSQFHHRCRKLMNWVRYVIKYPCAEKCRSNVTLHNIH